MSDFKELEGLVENGYQHFPCSGIYCQLELPELKKAIGDAAFWIHKYIIECIERGDRSILTDAEGELLYIENNLAEHFKEFDK